MVAKEDRLANLRRASQMYRVNAQRTLNKIDSMTDEDIDRLAETDPNLKRLLELNDSCAQEEISISPPWETSFAEEVAKYRQEQGISPERVNLFQKTDTDNSNYNRGYTGSSFMNNNSYYTDERIKQFTPGMKLYGINPMNFYSAEQMVAYYNELEADRKYKADQEYRWACLFQLSYADNYKFKSADEIYAEMEQKKKEEEEERQRLIQEEIDEVGFLYDQYDSNGVKRQKAPSFRVRNEAGEIIGEVKRPKDKQGHSYRIVSYAKEQKEAVEEANRRAQFANAERVREIMHNRVVKQYIDNKNKWARWKQLPPEEFITQYENERVDWNKHASILSRAISMASYSKKNFDDILRSCSKELKYSNRPDFFRLSYDFDRDLHYRELQANSIEELDSDPAVQQRLQSEFELKRKLFIDNAMANQFHANMESDASCHPSVPHPDIDSLTLEDYEKPENQIMYTKMCSPQLAMENAFIPANMQVKTIPLKVNTDPPEVDMALF